MNMQPRTIVALPGDGIGRVVLEEGTKITPRVIWEVLTHPRWSLGTLRVGSPRLRLPESYLDRVADPAAGSYFIENLTDALAKRAWGLFLVSLKG